MKKLIIVAIMASILSGCAGGFKSYYALQDECEDGVIQSCKDLRSRNRTMEIMAPAAEYLDNYDKQQRAEAIARQQTIVVVNTHQ